MKKKIIIVLIIFSFFFLVGGIYITTTIETVTSRLDNLIKLHQVEILREHLLIHLKRVQNDLNLRHTLRARSIDTVIIHVRNMEGLIKTCFDCHHSENALERLSSLRLEIEKYKDSLSRVMTIRANISRLETEEDITFKIGERLIARVNNMISATNLKLGEKTTSVLGDIAHTKIILYILVALGPISIAFLAIILIKGFTKPITTLLDATKRLKDGDLDYKIKGLKDEFGEVAASFNEMSGSLKDNLIKIQENEKRYRLLFEGAGDAIFIIDTEGENIGRIVSANRAAAGMHGYSIDELLGLNLINDIDTPDEAAKAPERIKQILDGKWFSAEITHRKKDGTVFPVEMSAGLFEFMGHKYIMAFDRDITERKESEKALLRSHVMFTTVLDSIDSAIYVADLKTYEILYINNHLRKLFGDLEGKICWQVLHPDQSAPCSFCSNNKLLTVDDKPAGVYEWEFQDTINNKWYDIRDRAIEWVDGNIVRFEIATDITERKIMDETLSRAEQMKLVGEWAAGLAHEIKNALAGIKISVEVLSEELNLKDEDKKSVLKAVEEIKRIELLLKRMLNFARPPELRLSITNINEILDKAVSFALLQPSNVARTEKQVEVLRDYDDNLPIIMADRLQLRQVFMNIVMNAIDAMRNSGILTLKTSYNEASNSILIELSDTGEGFEKEIIDNIYRPFFTTKAKGSGLGLAISRRIVELHGGDMSAKNRPDGGAIFSIRIPVKEKGKGS